MDKIQDRESRLPYKEEMWEAATYFRKNSMLHAEQSSLFNELVLICLNEMTAKIELHSDLKR